MPRRHTAKACLAQHRGAFRARGGVALGSLMGKSPGSWHMGVIIEPARGPGNWILIPIRHLFPSGRAGDYLAVGQIPFARTWGEMAWSLWFGERGQDAALVHLQPNLARTIPCLIYKLVARASINLRQCILL